MTKARDKLRAQSERHVWAREKLVHFLRYEKKLKELMESDIGPKVKATVGRNNIWPSIDTKIAA